MTAVRWLLSTCVLCFGARLAAAGDGDISSAYQTALPEFVQDAGSGVTTVDEWMAFGPLLHNVDDHDELEAYGISRESLSRPAVDASSISALARVGVALIIQHEVESPNLAGLFKTAPRRGKRLSAVYVISRINATEASRVWMFVQNPQDLDLWINGSQIRAWRKNDFYSIYDVPMQAGENRLLLRVPDVTKSQHFAVRYSRGTAAAAFERCFAGSLFPSVIWQHGADPLATCSELFASEARIESIGSGTAASASMIDPPAEGICTIKIAIGPEAFTGVFFRQADIGPNEYFRRHAAKYISAHNNEASLTALLRRLDILEEARSQSVDGSARSLDLNYRFRWTVTELQRALEALEQNEEPFRNQPGMHICGFVSKLDDRFQYYRVFIPNVRDRRPIPLAILMTPALVNDVPFLESPIAAKQDNAERIAAVADRVGIAVVWPGYRTNPTGSPVEFTHLDEVLRDVLDGWPIDAARVGLLAYSSAGITTCMAVTRNPKRYAAVAFNDAVLHRRRQRAGDEPATDDLMESFCQACAVPIHVYHDHSGEHGDYQESVALAGLFSGRGKKVSVRIDNHPTRNGEPQQLEEQLGFLARASLPEHDFSYTTNPVRARTVAEAFAQRFIVVRPSQTHPGDAIANIEEVIAELSAKWFATSGATPLIRTDVELTDSEKRNTNLILIGNASSNAVWSEYRRHFALQLTEDKLGFEDHNWSGPLCFLAVLPHPENENRSIVLIGATGNLTALHLPDNPTREGLYKLAIWDCATSSPQLAYQMPE